MLVSTKKSLKKLQDLLKKEPQPVSMEKATKLFKQAFPQIDDPYRGLSKYKNKYPSYFKGIKIASITDEGDKIRNYLKRITKNKTEPFVTSTPKILKAAKADAGPATVKAIVNKLQEINTTNFIKTQKNSKRFMTKLMTHLGMKQSLIKKIMLIGLLK
jgi:hypothetical protein